MELNAEQEKVILKKAKKLIENNDDIYDLEYYVDKYFNCHFRKGVLYRDKELIQDGLACLEIITNRITKVKNLLEGIIL